MNFEIESILAHTFSSFCAIFISLCVVHGQYTDIQLKIFKKAFSYSFKYRLLVSEVYSCTIITSINDMDFSLLLPTNLFVSF